MEKKGKNCNIRELISIVVPCYNEEESLPIFYDEIINVSKKMEYVDFEYIFIDDGSRDNTLSLLKKMLIKDSRVKFISFSRNFGKEAAMLAGLKKANGDYVAIMDCDMQDPPSKIIEMYDILKKEDYDVVALCSPQHKSYSVIRKFFTNLYYKIAEKVMTVKQMPGARDYRLMKKIVANSVISVSEYNRYLKGIFSFVGFKTKWIEYEVPNRVAGNSKWNFWKLFKYALEGIVAFSTTPLVISTFVGLIICFISFIVGIILLIQKFIVGIGISCWLPLAVLILFFFGIQLFFIGVIGMYLSKMYLEVKRRPLYFIRETEDDKDN